MGPKRPRESGGGKGGGGGRGRGRGGGGGADGSRGGPSREARAEKEDDDDGDAFDDSGDEAAARRGGAEEEEEGAEAAETAGEKRLRLAKAYLSQMREGLASDKAAKRSTLSDEEDEGEEEGEGEERLGAALAAEARQARGEAQRPLARRLALPSSQAVAPGTLWRGHERPVTALALSADDSFAVSSDKGGTLFVWDVETGKRSRLPQAPPAPTLTGPCAPPRSGAACVLSLALSSDGRLLASGGLDRHVRVWDLRCSGGGGATASHSVTFPGHRDTVTALAFRPGVAGGQLLSASSDRSLKAWACEERSYADTLFGHSSDILALCAGRRERAVSCGADRTCRLWKLGEDSQLVFQAAASCGGLESLAWASSNEWVTGARDGSIQRWSALKKKPAGVWAAAHGPIPPPAPTPAPLEGGAGPAAVAAAAAAERANAAQRKAGGSGIGAPSSAAAKSIAAARAAAAASSARDEDCARSECARWVSALARAGGTDLLASGAGDGCVRLWRVGEGQFGFESRGGVAARGFVNGLALASSGRFLLAGMGQEPRLGRWARDGGAKNGVLLHQLNFKGEEEPSH